MRLAVWSFLVFVGLSGCGGGTSSQPDDLVPFTITFLGDQNGHLPIDEGYLLLESSLPLKLESINQQDVTVTNLEGDAISNSIVGIAQTDTGSQVVAVQLYNNIALQYSESYKVVINSTWVSASGQRISPGYSIEVTSEPDTQGPSVVKSYFFSRTNEAASTITVYYNEALDAESIDENLITIENKVTGDSFPVSILPPHRDDEIRIRPVEFLAYETEYELIIAPGIPDLSGNPSIETFRKSITTDRDYNGPKLLSIRSSDAAEMIGINTSFDLVFSEAISPNVEGIVYLHLVFDDNTFSSVPGIPVPTTNTVLDNVLTIVPTEPLKHGEEYIIDINNGRNRRGYVEDLHGNERVSIAPTGIYKTVPYPNKIDIDFSIEHVEVNLQNNKAYALDQQNQKLVVLDLTTDTVEGAYSLDHTPSRLCLDDEYDRIFITYTDSPTVSEYTLATPEKLGDISWSPDKSAGNTPDEPQHNGILCGTEKLYLSDMAHNPQLFEIDRHAPHSVKRIEAIEGVGEFQLTSDGDMYVVSQYGGRASTKAERYQNHNGTWNLVDDTNFLNYYEYRKDPIDAPIFVDEQNGFLISKRYIFNRLDLNDIVHDFGEGRLISAVDFVNGHIVVDDGIYTYPGLQKVEYIPVSTMGGAFFNLSGDLHLVDEKTSELLPISHTDL